MPTRTTLPVVTSAFDALHHTRFINWFPLYKRYSPKATIIDLLQLQPDFLEWFEEDGLVLPEDSDNAPVNASNRITNFSSSSNSSSDGKVEEDDEDESQNATQRQFGQLNQRIRQIVEQYEGAVFPKMDWSAPLDAAWMVPGTSLRCTEPSDVYLLLKSSDFINKDITQLYELKKMVKENNQEQNHSDQIKIRPNLILKKFFSIPTSHEFRCFVRAGQLVCISQRDTGTFFEHLQPTEMQNTIKEKLITFFDTVLYPNIDHDQDSKSVSHFPIQDFVWDAYLTRDLNRVLIIDINPYLERTDALLWEWSEVEEEARKLIFEPHLTSQSNEQDWPKLRLVTSRAQTTQSFPTYAHNMMPSDIVGLSQGTDIAEFARQFNQQLSEAALEEEVDG